MKYGSKSALGDWLDGAATCASAACLVHCLALPVLIALLPALSGSIDPGEQFHRIILLFALPTSALALVPGWRASGAAGPLVVGVAGLTLLAAGLAFSHRPLIETGSSVAGSLLLASAHFANWRRRRASCATEANCGAKEAHEC